MRFLDEQPADLEDTKLAELRSTFHLGAEGNAEIALSWLDGSRSGLVTSPPTRTWKSIS